MSKRTLGGQGLMSFDALERALNDYPDQTTGIAGAISDIGEPYIVFSAMGIARPGDEKIVESLVVKDMCSRLDAYFEGKSGRIYWRHRLEFAVSPHHAVLRFDVHGPDEDVITGMKCVMDKNWRQVKAYCRLIRTSMPIPEAVPERKVA